MEQEWRLYGREERVEESHNEALCAARMGPTLLPFLLFLILSFLAFTSLAPSVLPLQSHDSDVCILASDSLHPLCISFIFTPLSQPKDKRDIVQKTSVCVELFFPCVFVCFPVCVQEVGVGGLDPINSLLWPTGPHSAFLWLRGIFAGQPVFKTRLRPQQLQILVFLVSQTSLSFANDTNTCLCRIVNQLPYIIVCHLPLDTSTITALFVLSMFHQSC